MREANFKETEIGKIPVDWEYGNAGDYIDDIAFAQLVYSITKSTLFSSYVFAVKIVFSFLYSYYYQMFFCHVCFLIFIFSIYKKWCNNMVPIAIFYNTFLRTT